MDITALLRLVIEKGASDLHLAVPSPPVLRLRGRLIPLSQLPPVTPEAARRCFESITTERQREIFYQRRELDFAYTLPELARFRVNAAFQRGSISLTFRMVPTKIPTIEELGLPEVCKSLVLKPRGLVLVTGPTGSGKSTTLAAMINYLNEREARKVITIEDPVEFLHSNKKCFIVQRELGEDTLSFASGLKHALRQDPDVILVGEMRDLETIATAITAAETGHLVLSTLHTSGAAQTIDRIIDVFPAHQQPQVRAQLALILQGVLSQALLPRADGGGRIAAFEIMLGSPAIRNLIREGKTFQIPTYLETGSQQGMQTLDQALALLVKRGAVTLEEALLRAQNAEELKKAIAYAGESGKDERRQLV
jgi:twitching motility protein PilT